jgi:hypothetical protein
MLFCDWRQVCGQKSVFYSRIRILFGLINSSCELSAGVNYRFDLNGTQTLSKICI